MLLLCHAAADDTPLAAAAAAISFRRHAVII